MHYFRTTGCNSVCQLYSHLCNEDLSPSCIFCEEMSVMREMGQLKVPSAKDTEEEAVKLFTKMAEYDITKEAEAKSREEEEKLGQQLGLGRLELIFLDYLHS